MDQPLEVTPKLSDITNNNLLGSEIIAMEDATTESYPDLTRIIIVLSLWIVQPKLYIHVQETYSRTQPKSTATVPSGMNPP